MHLPTPPWKFLTFRKLWGNKRLTRRKGNTSNYRIGSRVVRRNIYLCLEQITRDEKSSSWFASRQTLSRIFQARRFVEIHCPARIYPDKWPSNCTSSLPPP